MNCCSSRSGCTLVACNGRTRRGRAQLIRNRNNYIKGFVNVLDAGGAGLPDPAPSLHTHVSEGVLQWLGTSAAVCKVRVASYRTCLGHSNELTAGQRVAIESRTIPELVPKPPLGWEALFLSICFNGTENPSRERRCPQVPHRAAHDAQPLRKGQIRMSSKHSAGKQTSA